MLEKRAFFSRIFCIDATPFSPFRTLGPRFPIYQSANNCGTSDKEPVSKNKEYEP
jgi:hypothetical protein